ncbi:hypothetical protein [Corynebacterium doosanense]|uniref:hypothetical protein n=1 Tax=Corynebacterium doosanense TaxID=1121358 RepID=UPI00039EE8DC|nr:hypothetical protein [Corynebacterium doosanense]
MGPHTRQATEGREFSATDSLLWSLVWAMWENTVATAQAAGNKKAKMPAPKRPTYPWSEAETGRPQMLGNAGNHSQDEILEYLDNL